MEMDAILRSRRSGTETLKSFFSTILSSMNVLSRSTIESSRNLLYFGKAPQMPPLSPEKGKKILLGQLDDLPSSLMIKKMT
jgi:hypothetical protein